MGVEPVSSIPPALAANVVATWGAAGRRWLTELPRIVADVAEQWHLDVGIPYALSYHWVTAARRADGRSAVLKLGVPGEAHLRHEAAALAAYDGCGAVRLLAYDEARGALLLERADPGTPASTLVPERDPEATAAAIGLMQRLHRPPSPGCPLPDLDVEGASFREHLRRHPTEDPLPRRLVERAGRLFEELCVSASRRVLLHGDLHHDNVLRATREPWLAIDPHGWVGDPGYDVGAVLYNPDPDRRDDALVDLVPARVEQLSDGLGLPRERVVAWGFVMAVLSEVWTVQDGVPPGSRALDVAIRLLPELS